MKVVLLEVEDMEIEYEENCFYDFLKMEDVDVIGRAKKVLARAQCEKR